MVAAVADVIFVIVTLEPWFNVKRFLVVLTLLCFCSIKCANIGLEISLKCNNCQVLTHPLTPNTSMDPPESDIISWSHFGWWIINKSHVCNPAGWSASCDRLNHSKQIVSLDRCAFRRRQQNAFFSWILQSANGLGAAAAEFFSNDRELEVTKWLQCWMPSKNPPTWLFPIRKEADEDTFVADL